MKILLLLLVSSMFAKDISIQILGSGGPEFSKRASSSYLIWIDGKAKILVDVGGGSFLRFSQSSAKLKDLDFIAITHLHIDHSADLPQFMKAGYFTDRTRMLPILGTIGSGDFPNIKTYLKRLFGNSGAYAYMRDILTSQSDSFQIKAIMLDQGVNVMQFGDIKVSTVGVHHGIMPALAYTFEVYGKKIVFSGDTSANTSNLISLAKNADYLIVSHAVAQNAGRYAKHLHMTPKRIGEVAKKANVKNLILSHRMKRTYGKEKQSQKEIRQNYKNKIIWAEDLLKKKIL